MKLFGENEINQLIEFAPTCPPFVWRECLCLPRVSHRGSGWRRGLRCDWNYGHKLYLPKLMEELWLLNILGKIFENTFQKTEL